VKRRASTRAATIVSGLVLLSLVTACGSAADGTTEAVEESPVADDAPALTVYSGRSEELVGPILEEFTEATGTEVEVRYADSPELALLIETEGERTPADVFVSQSPGALGYLAGMDALGTLSEDTLALVDEQYRNAAGHWVGVTGRVRVLVVNTDLVDVATLPTSVLDLTDPAYRGQVALAPSNSSFQDFVTAFRETQGDDVAADWLAGMAANDAQVYADNTAIVTAVGRGEVPMGLTNHYYSYRALAEEPDLPLENVFFPDGDIGSLLITTGAAQLAASDQPEQADELIRFLLDESAQTFFTEETFEYPLASDVQPAADLPALASLGVATFDLDDLGGGLSRTLELIEDAGFAD